MARVARSRSAEPVKAPSSEPVVTAPGKTEPAAPKVDYDAIIARYKEKATTPKRAIRSHCIECMGGMVAEVNRCTTTNCSLHAFRAGQNPYHKLSKHNQQSDEED